MWLCHLDIWFHTDGKFWHFWLLLLSEVIKCNVTWLPFAISFATASRWLCSLEASSKGCKWRAYENIYKTNILLSNNNFHCEAEYGENREKDRQIQILNFMYTPPPFHPHLKSHHCWLLRSSGWFGNSPACYRLHFHPVSLTFETCQSVDRPLGKVSTTLPMPAFSLYLLRKQQCIPQILPYECNL